MMPLMMRRSSSRAGPVRLLGKSGLIRAHCRSLNQNKPARMIPPACKSLAGE
jgi:hypothetical protein